MTGTGSDLSGTGIVSTPDSTLPPGVRLLPGGVWKAINLDPDLANSPSGDPIFKPSGLTRGALINAPGAVLMDGDAPNLLSRSNESLPPPRTSPDYLYIDGTDTNDVLTGTVGKDDVAGFAGNDDISGLEGDDILRGDRGRDVIFGNEGSDFLFGGRDADTLYGNRGADKLQGHEGDDVLFGNRGRDLLDGGTGNNELWGGNGTDTFALGGGIQRINDFVQGTDQFGLSSGLSYENLSFTQVGADVMITANNLTVATVVESTVDSVALTSNFTVLPIL